MRLHDVEQGTPEWMRLRLGIPTASRVDQLLTPKTLKLSAEAPKYRNQLLAEWLVGHPVDWGNSSGWMERGRDMEAEARAWYELQYDCEVRQVGFLTRDDGLFGGSPDGLVDAGTGIPGQRGGVEIKVPALHTFVGYLLDPDSLVAKYRGQVQAYLYITGREWWDVVAYSPDFPPVVRRVEADREYMQALDAALVTFIADLLRCRDELAPFKLPTPAEQAAA